MKSVGTKGALNQIINFSSVIPSNDRQTFSRTELEDQSVNFSSVSS